MIIETNRLYLLPPNSDLADSVVNYYIRNKNFLKEFEPSRSSEYYTKDYQKKSLCEQKLQWQKKNSCRLYIAPKENPDVIIGYVALNGIVMGAFCSCYLSYQLDQSYVNMGFTTEAVNKVVDFAFDELRLHRIEANIMPRNFPSRRVVEKCNFIKEGSSKKIYEDKWNLGRSYSLCKN